MQDAMSCLVFWEDHVVQSCCEQTDGSLLIKLSEYPARDARCGACGESSTLVHERTWRRVRERDWLDRRVWLHVPVRRMDCHHCGARVTERIGWLNRHARLTERLRVWVETLAELLPIAHVAKLTGLHWHTIKEIDKARLQHRFGNFEGRGVRRLVMDEFALHKGHRYATVVMDAGGDTVFSCPATARGRYGTSSSATSSAVSSNSMPATTSGRWCGIEAPTMGTVAIKAKEHFRMP